LFVSYAVLSPATTVAALQPGNGGKTVARQKVRAKVDKDGSGRAAFDQAAAIEALAWARGGQQLELIPQRALRLVGVEPAPDDAETGRVGRPPGARSTAPAAWREWLLATHGSVIEGLVKTGTAPVAAIAAELAQAYQALWAAVHGAAAVPLLSSSQILELVTTAAQMRLTAQRYAAPYQHSQAPQPVDRPPEQRVAIGLFVGAQVTAGQVDAGSEAAAAAVLAGMLGVDPGAIRNSLKSNDIIEGERADLNARDLNAPAPEGS
jgi:hypothetical protein